MDFKNKFKNLEMPYKYSLFHEALWLIKDNEILVETEFKLKSIINHLPNVFYNTHYMLKESGYKWENRIYVWKGEARYQLSAATKLVCNFQCVHQS